MRKITETMLRRAHACTEQLNLFIELFPTGVVPTREVCASVADKFSWGWAASHLLPLAAQYAYDEAVAAAWRTYDEAYTETCAAAWRAFDEACAAAFADAWASV